MPDHQRSSLIDAFERGSIFFDLDASWNPPTADRRELLPALRDRGVATVALQYDLFPCTHPEWFTPEVVREFAAHLDAHLGVRSSFLCISEHTRSTLIAYAEAGGFDPPDTTVIPMGVIPIGVLPVDAAAHSSSEPYFLAVGTVEPRKNLGVVLDAFEGLRSTHPSANLVIVGRPGWNSDGVIERLRSHPAGVEWRTDVSDAELEELYREAHAVVVASVTEGFGLPVIEALAHRVPVLSSTGGSLVEAGGEIAEYFDPRSADELRSLMARHLDDPDHHQARRELTRAFSPPSWHDAARAVAVALQGRGGLEATPALE